MNGILKKLKNLNAYLKVFQLEDRPDVTFNYVTGYDDAANLLQTKTGLQVLVVRPTARISFQDSDSPRSCIMDTAFFVLEKDLGSGRTSRLECEQYDRTLEVLDAVFEQILDDSEGCEDFASLTLLDADIQPEIKVFASWNGYSLALEIE